MQILTLTLKDFKGHADGFFEFSRGTNAICGENGVGKTSIFEAIAWVVFDHCEYSKKELIRAGATNATATVEFLSNRDERQYRITRSTHRGFEIYDPQLNAKLDIKKREDVQCWLCEHLGVPVTTELSRLFGETIGIPQGTFTADFLKRPSDRKKIFDPILKVEDYKQTFERTRDLEAYALAQVQQIEQKLALYEVQLADWEALKTQIRNLEKAIATDTQFIKTLEQQICAQQQELEKFGLKAKEIESLNQKQQQLAQQIAQANAEGKSLEQSLSQAQSSRVQCDKNRNAFEQFKQAQEALKDLETQRQHQLKLRQQKDLLQKTLNAQLVKQSKLTTQLEALTDIATEIEQLSPLIATQDNLELNQRQIQSNIQELLLIQRQLDSLSKQIQQFEDQQTKLVQDITTTQALEPQLKVLPALEQQRQLLQTALNHWEVSQDFLIKLQPIFQSGKLERDRHRTSVQTALKHIESLDGQWELIEDALKQGAILNTNLLKSLHQVLTELSEAASPEKLTAKLDEINHKIQDLQIIQTQFNLLSSQSEQLATLQNHLAIAQQQFQLQTDSIRRLPELEAQQAGIEKQLETLNNPKQQIQLLKKRLQTQASLTTQHAQLTQQISLDQKQLTQLELNLTEFKTLEVQYSQTQQHLQSCQVGYQIYLQHERAAQSVPQLEQQIQTWKAKLESWNQISAQLTQSCEELSQDFKPEQFAQLQKQVQQQQAELNLRKGGLQPKQMQLESLKMKNQDRQKIDALRKGDRQHLKQKQKIYKFVQTARHIYKQSGPRISQLYQQEISWEADRLFRELLHRPDIALKWTDDYDIQVQEQGHWRSFKSLSGGEQMCAALAVRLALLKVLADINIAFFDEPTTNMDQLRRSQLAEAIGNLKSFRQLFVISHDDTFENITETIIRLNKT